MAVLYVVAVVILSLALAGVLAVTVQLVIMHIKSRPAKTQPEPEEVLPETEEPEEPEERMVDLFADDPFGGDAEETEEKESQEQPEEEGGNAKEAHAPRTESGELLAYDKLCSLPANRSFIERCVEVLEKARQIDQIYAVAYLDIDRFRFINSIKGMNLGDYVLVNLSQEIQKIFPPSSLLTRISADHFAIVFPGMDNTTFFDDYYNQILKACEKIRDNVGIKGGIRVSVGLTVTDSSSNPIAYNYAALLSKANIARHCQKIVKSDAYFPYEEAMVTSKLYGESALDDYTENQYGDDFTIYYQSVRDISANKIAGTDAFVRWNCQDEGKSSEPLTPDNGRLPCNITKIFYQACRAASRWRKSGKEIVPLYMHITELEFFKGDFDEFAAKCLSEFQLEPALINIVVDVGVVRVNWTVASAQMKRLRDTGFKVGICGIDTKTQNLDFLAGIPASFIKLQAGFMKGVPKQESKIEALRYMMAMASSLNLRVVVEGVDTIEQMQTLQRIGVQFIEGRFTGFPAIADDYVRSLEDYIAKRGQNTDATVFFDDLSLNHGDYEL